MSSVFLGIYVQYKLMSCYKFCCFFYWVFISVLRLTFASMYSCMLYTSNSFQVTAKRDICRKRIKALVVQKGQSSTVLVIGMESCMMSEIYFGYSSFYFTLKSDARQIFSDFACFVHGLWTTTTCWPGQTKRSTTRGTAGSMC